MLELSEILPNTSYLENTNGLDFLEHLVGIDSQTANVEGVNRVQKLLADKLARLGFRCSFHNNLESPTGHLLYAIKKGLSDEQITFIGHADTVCSPKEGNTFEIDFLAQTIRGPGIGDDKGSLVMAIESLKTFLDQNPIHHHTLVFISSPCEETGSIGFQNFFKDIGLKSKVVIGLEPALFNGSMISSRNGNRWYKISIKGKSSHAGRFGEPFINAAHFAAEFIHKLSLLNDIDNKVKINVASLVGGSEKYNVTCESVEIKLDVRFPTLEKRNEIDQAIKRLIDDSSIKCHYSGDKCQVTLEIMDDCPPLPLGEELHLFVSFYLKTIGQLEEGKTAKAEHSGGAADINYFARPGLIYIDGTGPITKSIHTVNEAMNLKSFFSRQHAMTEALNYLNIGRP